jgi:hypothetical protein
VAQLAFSPSGPVLLAPVPSSSGTPVATAWSEAAGGLLASPLSATRCYMEGMARERTRRESPFLVPPGQGPYQLGLAATARSLRARCPASGQAQ